MYKPDDIMIICDEDVLCDHVFKFEIIDSLYPTYMYDSPLNRNHKKSIRIALTSSRLFFTMM
jgi:hypothetical protein